MFTARYELNPYIKPFIKETECVYCAVRNESLSKTFYKGDRVFTVRYGMNPYIKPFITETECLLRGTE